MRRRDWVSSLVCFGLLAAAPAVGQEIEKSEIAAPAGAENADFGYAAAVDGDVLVVSAPGADVAAGETTIEDAGAVFVYRREAGEWRLEERLDSPTPVEQQRFGHAVDVSRDRTLVGGPGDPGGPKERGANPPPPEDAIQGAVFVFRFGTEGWEVEAQLALDEATTTDWSWGYAVGISGDRAVVGAPDARYGGNVTPFELRDGSWTYAWAHTDLFHYRSRLGAAVDIDGGTIVVGAPGWEGRLDGQGAVEVLVRSGPSSWFPYQTFEGPPQVDGAFGSSVSLSDDHLAVGAPRLDGDEGELDIGAVFLYRRDAGKFAPAQRLEPVDTATHSEFGRNIALFGDSLVVDATLRSTADSDLMLYRVAQGSWVRQTNAESAALSGVVDGPALTLAMRGGTVVAAAQASVAVLEGFQTTPPAFRFRLDSFWPVFAAHETHLAFPVSGGVPPIAYEPLVGDLPLVAAFDQDRGSLHGVAKAPGTYTVTVAATDADGRRIQKTYDVVVQPFPEAWTFTMPPAVLERPYLGYIRAEPWPSGGQLEIIDEDVLPLGLEQPPELGRAYIGTPTEARTTLRTARFTGANGEVSNDVRVALDVLSLVDLSRRGRARERLSFGADLAVDVVRPIELIGGSLLDVSLRGDGAENVTLSLTVDDDSLDTTPVPLGAALASEVGEVSVRRFEVPQTNRYFLRLHAPDELEARLRLTIAASVPRRISGRAFVTGLNTPVAFFAAPDGARVVIDVQPVNRVNTRVTLENVESPQGRVDRRKRRVARGLGARARIRVPSGQGERLWVPFRSISLTEGFVDWKIRVRTRGYRFAMPSEGAGFQ